MAYVRLSVTDRCNLRCTYCMPERPDSWTARSSHASIAEHIEALERIDERVGVHKIRFTGGEPLIRRDFTELVRAIRARFNDIEICMTTNAVHLAEQAWDLAEAGISRVNISFDSLRPERVAKLCGKDVLSRIIAGIDAAVEAGLTPVKLNTVLLRSLNLDELPALVRFAAGRNLEIRFIELMDIGDSPVCHKDEFVSADEAIALIEEEMRLVLLPGLRGVAQPARVDVGGRLRRIGFIRPVTQPFCGSCDRVRIDTLGQVHACLMAERPVAASFVESAFQSKEAPSSSWQRNASMCSIGG